MTVEFEPVSGTLPVRDAAPVPPPLMPELIDAGERAELSARVLVGLYNLDSEPARS